MLTNDIHLHVPEGAIPKNESSAGVAITSALLSLAFDEPVLKDLAMTGELMLNGRVMVVAGLKERIVAAKRKGSERCAFRSRTNMPGKS